MEGKSWEKTKRSVGHTAHIPACSLGFCYRTKEAQLFITIIIGRLIVSIPDRIGPLVADQPNANSILDGSMGSVDLKYWHTPSYIGDIMSTP